MVTVTAVALVSTRSDGDDSPARTGSSANMTHIHGLGVDPGSGALYAGTHLGLFRLDEDSGPVRVADREQDLMGFSVVGDGHFVASGHPGPGQGGPAAVGLIESTDAGRSWRTLSLAGQADFHALEALHGKVYGHSGGQLMVSDDGGRSWGGRASLAAADLAVSPVDPDVVLATTAEGVAMSSDGGRSFAPVPDSPLLLFVTWPTAVRVLGIDSAGAVYESSDGGISWRAAGSVLGTPQALTATDAAIYVATEAGIYATGPSGPFRLTYPTS